MVLFLYTKLKFHNLIVFWYKALPLLKKNNNIKDAPPLTDKNFHIDSSLGLDPRLFPNLWIYGNRLFLTVPSTVSLPPLHLLHVSYISLLTASLNFGRSRHLISWPEQTIYDMQVICLYPNNYSQIWAPESCLLQNLLTQYKIRSCKPVESYGLAQPAWLSG